jgi:hypothetical protein
MNDLDNPGSRSNAKTSLLLTGLLLASVSCGSSAGSDAPSADLPCTHEATAYCEARTMCWPEGESDYRFAQSWGNKQNCVDERKRICLENVAHHGTTVAVPAIETCAAARAAQSCPDFLANIALPTSACPVTSIGTYDNGAGCVAGNQCKSGYCDRAATETCGKCADRLGIDQACDQTSDCASGLTCQLDAITQAMKCAPPPMATPKAKLGEACGGTFPACGTGLDCVGAAATMKVCQTLVAMVGGACDASSKVAPDCDGALYLACNRTSHVCEKRNFADVGQPCNELADGSTAICRGGANCVRGKDPVSGKRPAQGTCVADVLDGEACFTSSADGPGCQPPLRCVLDAAGATTGKCRRNDDSACTK